MLCVWWNFKRTLTFELISDDHIVNDNFYAQQLKWVNHVLKVCYPALVNTVTQHTLPMWPRESLDIADNWSVNDERTVQKREGVERRWLVGLTWRNRFTNGVNTYVCHIVDTETAIFFFFFQWLIHCSISSLLCIILFMMLWLPFLISCSASEHCIQ